MFDAVNKGVQSLWKKPDPKELVRKWQADLRSEQRKIDRQIRDIQFEEKKVQKAIKEAAKRSDMNTCKVLAREIVQSRKAVGRLYVNKAQMMCVGNALSEQLAMVRVAGSLQKSSEVMKVVNESLKLPEIRSTMIQLSKEMMKAGLIAEVMDDAIDSALGGHELEEETEAEVDKVLAELALETAVALPSAKARPSMILQHHNFSVLHVTDATDDEFANIAARLSQVAAPEAQQEEEPEDLLDLQQRLDAVRT